MANFQSQLIHQRGLKCSVERHLVELGAVAMAVYFKVAALTHGGESACWISAQTVADFLDCSPRQTRNAFQRLDETGWIPIGSGSCPSP
jgi:hypothetical protein